MEDFSSFTIHRLPFTITLMLSRIYGSLMNARNSFYETGVFAAHSLGAKTISIGNITIGGTGKTPLVALVAEILAARGETVGILTRGYGRDNPKRQVLVSDGEKVIADVKSAGDEPFELAAKLLGKALVIANANRVEAAIWAREKFNVTAFVLDDAFQHRRARRDLDIVCVDAVNPFGNGKNLPTGVLREPLENLRRADAIVITKANLANDVSNLKSQISKYNPNCPIFVSENRVSKLTNLKDFSVQAQNSSDKTSDDELRAKNYLAFCALGNPNNFFEQLRRENFNIVAAHRFPDHHFYTRRDIEIISEKARQVQAEILLTTAKDAVKLANLKFSLPCLVVENDLFFGGNDFRRWLLSQAIFGK